MERAVFLQWGIMQAIPHQTQIPIGIRDTKHNTNMLFGEKVWKGVNSAWSSHATIRSLASQCRIPWERTRGQQLPSPSDPENPHSIQMTAKTHIHHTHTSVESRTYICQNSFKRLGHRTDPTYARSTLCPRPLNELKIKSVGLVK